jgi:phosphotransferase system enzyme I (PtsP)
MTTPRRLLARLRDLMAHGSAPLPEMVRLVAAEMVAEVCSLYVHKPGDLLELAATEGLRPEAVGRTRLRVGEGIVGLVAATHQLLNLPDAQSHPAFASRPETGEEAYASMLAVPVRRAGRVLGVLTVQNRNPRRYDADEVEVLETVAMLLAAMLAAGGAADTTEEGIIATVPRRFDATPLAPGIAIGPVRVADPLQAPHRLIAEDPAAELARLDRAVATMRRDLDTLIEGGLAPQVVEGPDGDASREILDAYRLFAGGSGWLRRVADAVRGGISAEAAVHRVAGDLRDRMRRLVDPHLRERLADIEDVIGRLLAALDGGATAGPLLPGTVLLARRLGPAELLDWHTRGIAGVVIEDASPAGHAAILARALGLPAVAGARGITEAAEDGNEAILDADEGLVVLRPHEDVRAAYRRALAARSAREAGWASLRDRPGRTRDGTRITLMLNVGLPLELSQIAATGAEGIGLFRTEIAMLARGAVVGTTEQTAVYARVLDAAGGRPVVFRTLDLGGDKLLPGSIGEEENPAMGWRSLRVGLDRPALLRRQLRALLLAAGGRPLSVMFPMVATVAELRSAKGLLRNEAAKVRPSPVRLDIGTMLEVPALMWQLDALLAEVDFVSVGTNDLMQFLFAADRGTPALANRYDLLSPPVIELLCQLIAACARAGVALSVCGEHAGRPLEAMTLVGLGVRQLSMSAASVLPIKALLAELDLPALVDLLASIRRTAAGAASVREPILAWAREHGVPV